MPFKSSFQTDVRVDTIALADRAGSPLSYDSNTLVFFRNSPSPTNYRLGETANQDASLPDSDWVLPQAGAIWDPSPGIWILDKATWKLKVAESDFSQARRLLVTPIVMGVCFKARCYSSSFVFWMIPQLSSVFLLGKLTTVACNHRT